MSIKSLQHSSLTDNIFYRSMLAGNEYYVPFTPADDILEEIVLTSSASSVTFSGLGAYTDYQHLQIRAVTQSTSTFGGTVVSLDPRIRFNSDIGSNYARHYLQGAGASGISSQANTSSTQINVNGAQVSSDDSNIYASWVFDVLDFSSSSKNTTVRSLSGTSNPDQPRIVFGSGAYFVTDAITSMELIGSGNFTIGSRFSLIGVR